MKIPGFLEHLRTDRGRPVPYINLWGTEDETRTSIRWDRSIGAHGVFLDDTDEKVPDFFRQNPQRQRECVNEGLCQVCARQIPWSRRTLVVSSMSVSWVKVAGLRGEHPAVSEPWLDERCAEFAISVCPALIRRTHDEDLQLIKIHSARQAVIADAPARLDGPLEAESLRLKPVLWSKILLPGFDVRRAPEPAGVNT